MGRIITQVTVANVLDRERELSFNALVDTGAAGLVLPTAWRDRLGALATSRTLKLETADQRAIDGEIAGPVLVTVEGFEQISTEATFIDMEPADGRYEPLVGYIVLEQMLAAVDMVGHRLVPVKYADLKTLA